MNIELRHLRYFAAVAEDLHFGKAAHRLGISQPPLSQQILALEREIGARLFERSNRRVELTSAGKTFLKEALEVLERVDAAAIRAERIHRGQVGEVKVGFFGSAPFVEGFQKLVFDFRAEHPDVDLILEEMPTYQQVDAILDGRLDLGFVRPLQPKPECQSAPKFDPTSASNFDPFARRGLTVALVSSELAGIAETRRARVA